MATNKEMIYNDAYGIKDKAVFEHIKSKLRKGFLGRHKEGISKARALKTTSLMLDKCDDIEDLGFLRFFPNLETFSLNSENLSDIDGLGYAPNLKRVFLASKWPGTVYVSAIGKCKTLEALDLQQTSTKIMTLDSSPKPDIQGWDALSGLSKLTYLGLPYMGIEDIGFVMNMTALQDVDLSGNPISDLSPLRGHPRINELYLGDCGIADISVLADIPELGCVCLGLNRIDDFSPLKKLAKLEYVDGENNGLTQQEIEKWKNEFSHIEADF